MTPQETVEQLQKERSEKLERDIAEFLVMLAAILEKWRSDVGRLISHVDQASPLSALSYLQAQLPAQLRALGYDHLIQEIVNSYDNADNAVYSQIEATGYSIHDLDALDWHSRSALQRIDQAKLTEIGSFASSTIAATVVQGQILGTLQSDIQAAIDKAVQELESSFALNSEAGMFRFERFVTWHYWSQISDNFLFFGPRDPKNRPFCAEHVGRVYTSDQISKMSNGQGLEVKYFCGGFRCRHIWVAQIPKDSTTTAPE